MENRKLNEALKGLAASLTEEQREKVKACKTPDELTALLGKLGVALPDELLDAVAGGVKYHEDGTRYDPGNILDLLEYYAESDRRCRERGVHPTDWAGTQAVEHEVYKEFFEK